MGTRFTNPMRRKLREGQPCFGIFVTLDDPTVTEVAVRSGLDWICVDMEHGHLDYGDLLNHLRAAHGSDLTVLSRVPTTSVDHVKRTLDLGAHGVVLPLIGNAEELRQGMAFGRYPPVGVRGLSNMRAADYGPMIAEYVAVADDETMIIPIIETVEASRNIDEILAVQGLEAVFFGPADLSQSYGHRAVWEGPGVAEDILRMAGLASERGIASAIMGLDVADIDRRLEQGFQIVGVGSDVYLLMKQMSEFAGRYKNAVTRLAFNEDPKPAAG